MPKTILVTGASSGFGAMTVRELADAGHTVFAGMRNTLKANVSAARDATEYAADRRVDLRPIDLDVGDQESVDRGIALLLDSVERLDVLVHNAGHMVLGPAEAFTTEDLAQVYDVNVL
ncbi:MAG: SDR family NAD(P)-dependent oxidoreductase, partial [Mycobacterium sp.]